MTAAIHQFNPNRVKLPRFKYPEDPATQFALAVDRKERDAGPAVQLACRRHLIELAHADQSPYYWDPNAANRFSQYTYQICRINYRGEWRPFKLLPWQEFSAGCVYGWKKRENHFRRFLDAYKETAKGSGKTPLGAAMSTYNLTSDRELQPLGYVVAKELRQARIAMGDIANMINNSPDLKPRIRWLGGGRPYSILLKSNELCRIDAIAAGNKEGAGQSGHRPTFVLVDEYHEHRTDDVVKQMRANFNKQQAQPLMLIITNAGSGHETPCGIEHHRALRVLSGQDTDDQYFAFIADLEEDDDPFEEDEAGRPTEDALKVWHKANPGLADGLPAISGLHRAFNTAKNSPTDRLDVARKNFGIWTDQVSSWISPTVWMPAQVEELSPLIKVGERPGRKKQNAYLTLDIGVSDDMSAGAIAWDMPDGTLEVQSKIWAIGDGLDDRARRSGEDWREWEKHGHLEVTEGKVVDFEAIADWVAEMDEQFNIVAMAYDNSFMPGVIDRLNRYGVKLREDSRSGSGILIIPHHQGGFIPRRSRQTRQRKGEKDQNLPILAMPTTLDTVTELFNLEKIKVLKNPALTSAVSGAYVRRSRNGLKFLDKDKSSTKIDAAVAFAMVIGLARAQWPVQMKRGLTIEDIQRFTKPKS